VFRGNRGTLQSNRCTVTGAVKTPTGDPAKQAHAVVPLLRSCAELARVDFCEVVLHRRVQPESGPVIDCYRLLAGACSLEVITLGCAITRLEIPDRAGRPANVVLGHARIEDYAHGEQYFGATVGRVANRIASGRVALDDRQVQLSQNHGRHHLHGGTVGFGKRIWNARVVSAAGVATLEMRLQSADGEEGYPGNLAAQVLYSLRPSGELRMEYAATTDAPTVVNMTNHSYFNLGGEGSGDMLAHELRVDAGQFCAVDAELIPTGELQPVAGTAFDFRRPASIGERIGSNDCQLLRAGGYDHCLVLDSSRTRSRGLRPVGMLSDPVSGRRVGIATDQPGLQLYSGNFLDGSVLGSSGTAYQRHAGVCLETQGFPDAPNHASFPPVTLRPGERYTAVTVWTFGVLS
jgi:aldose 1-epimerase